jgi:hypothetical protein
MRRAFSTETTVSTGLRKVVFTQFQGDAPDDVFDAQVEAVRRELVVLKALAETECPCDRSARRRSRNPRATGAGRRPARA